MVIRVSWWPWKALVFSSKKCNTLVYVLFKCIKEKGVLIIVLLFFNHNMCQCFCPRMGKS